MRAFIVLLAGLFVLAASGQELDKLSDDELLEILHRKDAREEFDRRLRSYDKIHQEMLQEKLEKRQPIHKFPSGYSTSELLEYLKNMEDHRAYGKAVKELQSRYTDGTAADQEEILNRLRALQREMLGTEGDRRHPWFQGLTRASGQILPGEVALALFQELYLDSSIRSGITSFLTVLEMCEISTPEAAPLLARLYERAQTIPNAARMGLGEDDQMEALIMSALPRCGQPGFDVLTTLPWYAQGRGIRAMGGFDTDEARELLFDLYARTPPEQTDLRGSILSALGNRWYRTRDQETEQLLRREVALLLKAPVTPYDVPPCRDAAELAGLLGFPEFYPYLEEIGRQNLLESALGRENPVEVGYLQEVVEKSMKRIEEKQAEAASPDASPTIAIDK